MVGITFLRVTTVLLVGFCVGVADQTGAVGGKAVDLSGFFLSSPKVRIMGTSNGEPRYQTTGDLQGLFQLAGIEPGVYTIKVTVPGFREKTVSDVRIISGQQTDLGTVILQVPGCDSPGVICDDFGLGDNDPIHAQGSIDVPHLCAVDIDEWKSTCTIPPARDPDSDFWVRPGQRGELYLVPLNGVRLALNPPTKWSKSGCISAVYSNREVRIDGLPLGSRVCIRTSRDRYAQVDLIRPRIKKVNMDFVTWQGKPDWPKLQVTRPQ
jgi:hypothetical protein